MDHFYSGLLFLIVLQQGFGHDSPDSFFPFFSKIHVVSASEPEKYDPKSAFTVTPSDTTDRLILIQDDFEQVVWPYPQDDPVQWVGDLDHFRLQSLDSATSVLRLDAPFAGYSTLYTQQSGVTGQWHFTLFQDFTPSSTNRTWFYLTSDQPLESDTKSGYALRFGENGSDKQIRLFRVDQGIPREILNVPFVLTSGGYQVRVTRDEEYYWQVEVRGLEQEEDWVRSEAVPDDLYQTSLYSGFYFTYSTTRADKFWIDQIEIRTFTARLRLESAEFRNQSQLILQFNQPVDTRLPRTILLRDSSNHEFRAETLHAEKSVLTAGFSPLSDGRYTLIVDSMQVLSGSGSMEENLYLDLRNPFYVIQASLTDAHHLIVHLSERVDLSGDIRTSILLDNQHPESLSIGVSTPSKKRSGDSLSNLNFSDAPLLNEVTTENDSENYPLRFRFQENIEYGKYLIGFNKVRDVNGWILQDSLYPVYRFYPPEYGDVQINEVLFDPLADPDDGYKDQTQYIELYNTTSYPISTEGLYYHKGADETGFTRAFTLICDHCSRYAPQGVIPPNGYVLLYPEPEETEFELSRLGMYILAMREFIIKEAGYWPFPILGKIEPPTLEYPATAIPLRYNAKTLSLTQSGGVLVLQKNETVLDSILYSEEWHHRALPIHKGYALERIQSTLSGLRKDNWGTSTGWIGGTPGWENSISIHSALPDFEDTWLVIRPDSFSPNNDGFEDHLLISYQLEATDYVLRIRIYDLEGRLIRAFFLGRAGRDGELLWDGRNDQGVHIQTGLYILLAEASGSDTARDLVLKLPIVVAGPARIP